jgi:hypothetical protein
MKEYKIYFLMDGQTLMSLNKRPYQLDKTKNLKRYYSDSPFQDKKNIDFSKKVFQYELSFEFIQKCKYENKNKNK